ncbi:FdhD protein [Sphingobium sp. AP50]|uniref:formate dehydrogenase accessory sulfurtransferase FdhD n=1 Tax=Sphingobium sp. AP50 TaxID=1884369 RepID=UPI0008D170A1|nr:formate dehydrogenase accessory sulfurtransferase FdhD [Sphingobium sp. AP50]SEJ81884.1 FdhD protein [Sphingobium sp. AP50]
MNAVSSAAEGFLIRESDLPSRSFAHVSASGERRVIERVLADEVPVALEYQGIGYAVLMATPFDLVDLAYGFSLSERLIDQADHILEVEELSVEGGILLRITLSDSVSPRILERVRHRASDASCGLCGIENLEQAMRPLPQVTNRSEANEAACFAALDALSEHQRLNHATGAVHAAAACASSGLVTAVREDVGRHNAFDKLIGSLLRAGKSWDGGFALLTSRCSFELVEKAVLAGCPMLATISAPTALAVDRAGEAGLSLHVLVRPDALLVNLS